MDITTLRVGSYNRDNRWYNYNFISNIDSFADIGIQTDDSIALPLFKVLSVKHDWDLNSRLPACRANAFNFL